MVMLVHARGSYNRAHSESELLRVKHVAKQRRDPNHVKVPAIGPGS